MLTITEALRKKGVVGTFVEFYGPGLEHLTIADRVTLGNMCPEYGATVAIFPIDDMTLDYLRFTGRDAGAGRARRGLCEGAGPVPDRRDAGCDVLGHAGARSRRRSSRAWPVRAGRRIACRSARAKTSFAAALPELQKAIKKPRPTGRAAAARRRRRSGRATELEHGSVVIAAITSCTNTSNPERDDRRRARGEEGGRARA